MGTSSSPARSTEHRLELTGVVKEAPEHKYPSLYQINSRVLLNELSRGACSIERHWTTSPMENLIGLHLKALTGSGFLAFGRQVLRGEMCRERKPSGRLSSERLSRRYSGMTYAVPALQLR